MVQRRAGKTRSVCVPAVPRSYGQKPWHFDQDRDRVARSGIALPGRPPRRAKADADTGLRTGSAAPSELSARPLEASIGFEVRRLRKSIDLTVADLGAAAGISAGMLSKIENGSISPSLGTLDALAKALNVPITRLFAETDERRDCSFVKAGTGVRIERRGTKAGHRYDLLGHSLGGAIVSSRT